MRKLIWLALLLATAAYSQPLEKDMQVFADRRAAFMEKIDPNGIAIFPGKPEYIRNLDIEFPYRQESNFYYLTGFEEQESILVLNPSDPQYKYILFVRKRDRRRETYDGPRAGITGAMATFKADTAFHIDDFESTIFRFIRYDRPIYYTFGINPETDDFIRKRMIERRSGGVWAITDPTPHLAEMRLIKNDGDWRMGLKKAIDISVAAHLEAIRSIEPGMYEYEIQAVFEYVYRKNGSPRNGYNCIVGSGYNSTILHYNLNNQKIKDGDMILMDTAAEYGYYTADITRSVPANGKFSKEQREVYQIVLDAQTKAMEMVRPGVRKSALDRAIDDVLGAGLVNLGFIKDKGDFRMFSLHGYAHWIGLEVHDVGAYSRNGESIILEPGMVFTLEPGLYVRPDIFEKMQERGYSQAEIARIRPRVEKYMNIGVRIEDDIVVTETGFKNLSKGVPREIDEIEELMRAKGVGNLTMQ